MSWFDKLFGNDISLSISIFSSCCNVIKDEEFISQINTFSLASE